MQYSFEDAVDSILAQHPEYRAEAYSFMRQALDAASEQFHKDKDSPHLSAEELYLGACAYALEEYGPLARLVLSRWGIRHSKDFGNIVYNLIDAGIFGKQKGDSREQFDNLQNLSELLDAPYIASPEGVDTNIPTLHPDSEA